MGVTIDIQDVKKVFINGTNGQRLSKLKGGVPIGSPLEASDLGESGTSDSTGQGEKEA